MYERCASLSGGACSVRPIFTVSSVTGVNLDLLMRFLRCVRVPGRETAVGTADAPAGNENVDADVEFRVDNVYTVPGTPRTIQSQQRSAVSHSLYTTRFSPALFRFSQSLALWSRAMSCAAAYRKRCSCIWARPQRATLCSRPSRRSGGRA